MKRKMNQPVGSTTVRADGIRYIKVAMDGPKQRRWMQYARFLWEAVNGDVPAGKRVLHRDGDATNDHIRNLMLGTAADALWIHYHKDPKKSAANYRKLRSATAKANRLRGRVNRMQNWLPTQWYAINVDHQRAWNNPKRKAIAVARELGLPIVDRKMWPVILGYPEGDRAEAIVVRCLGPELVSTAELLAAVTTFATRLGFSPMSLACLRSAICKLRKRGHVDGPRGRYRLTIQKPKPLAIVRGAQIVKHFQACCRVDSLSDLQL